MPACKFCNEPNLEWYQGNDEKWKLGIKLDINNYRQHRCKSTQEQEKPNNKRNWIKFTCTKCGNPTRQNIKLHKPKTINVCYDCDNM